MNRRDLAQLQSTPEWKEAESRFRQSKHETAQFFEAAIRVECFRFEMRYPKESAAQILGDIQGIPYYEASEEQERGFALRLAALILNPQNYLFPDGSPWMCAFEPTYGFRVWSESDFLDVIVCFGCSEMISLKSGSGFRPNSHRKDDISLIAGQLWEMLGEAFAAS